MMPRVVCLALALAVAAPLAAQEPANLADLAQLLGLEDRREFDVAVLRRASQHPDSTVRRRAAMTLGRIGDRGGVPLLLELLQDRDSLVRLEALFALGEIGDPAAAPELIRQVALPQTAGLDGVELVTALAKIGGPAADTAIARLLQRFPAAPEGTDVVAAAALQETWRLGPRSAAAARLPEYVRSASGAWRRNALWAATRIRLAAAAPLLVQAAGDADPLSRSYVARGLTAPAADSAALARAVFTAALRTLVNDEEAAVRVNALRALATYADSGLAGLAAPRLADRDPGVAIQAATTLGALGGLRAAADLAERVPSAATYGMRRALIIALARADGARAVSLAQPWRTDEDWRYRVLLADVTAAAGVPAARDSLVAMLGNDDARVVAAVLGALAQATRRGDSVALAQAGRLLAHDDMGVRAAAIGIVARERTVAVAPLLVEAYRRADTDTDNDARLAAVDGLADVAEESPAGRAEVERLFLGGVPRSPHYLVRKAAATRFGEPAVRRRWGALLPVETGRNDEEYRELVRRYLAPGAAVPQVTIDTERGNLVLQLYAWDAPMTVDNFLRLVDRRFFDNGRWHRVVPNFVIQDGDPRGDGIGGPGTTIRDEINRRRYDRGAVGMALAGPDTGGSQFFITHSPQPHLDGGYTVFGHLVAGWNVLDQVVQGDRIRRIIR